MYALLLRRFSHRLAGCTSVLSVSRPHSLPCAVPLSLVVSCAMSSPKNQQDLDFRDDKTIRIVHEATLQDLLRARNYPTLQLLEERNALLRERYGILFSAVQLTGELSYLSGGRNSVHPRLYTMTMSSSRRPILPHFFPILSLLAPPGW
jgi:hypothetical protein